jgi:hypothetical protein
MPAFTDGGLPLDINGRPAEGVYVPNVGTVAQQGIILGTDSSGSPYAATAAQLIAGTALAGSFAYSDGLRATYGASISGLASASSATDIFTIIGSATKTIRVTRLEISGTQTTAASALVSLILRSAADTGGTSSTPTVIPYDSNSAAGTAVVRAYTANPAALGSAVGTVKNFLLFLPAPATTAVGQLVALGFGDRPAQAIVLRGVAQTLAVNLGGTTITGGSFNINIEWTEE